MPPHASIIWYSVWGQFSGHSEISNFFRELQTKYYTNARLLTQILPAMKLRLCFSSWLESTQIANTSTDPSKHQHFCDTSFFVTSIFPRCDIKDSWLHKFVTFPQLCAFSLTVPWPLWNSLTFLDIKSKQTITLF